MKLIFRISRIILVILSIIFLNSCEEKPTPPVITTTAVSTISYTTATSGGAVTNEGGAAVTAKGVCWNTSPDPTISNNKTSDGTGAGSFSSSLTGLTAGTTYYVRAYATNTAGTGYGNQVTFTTSQIALATLTTTTITSITQTTAVSGGNITADNGSSVTARGVCWGTATNPTIALSTKTSDGTGTGSFVSNLISLQPGAIYYVRSYATNNAGTAYGTEVSFTTLQPPTATTAAATSLASTTATLNGTVNANNQSTTVTFEYGTTTSYGQTINAIPNTVTGSTNTGVSANLTGLTANTTYHFRVKAVSSVGTTNGSDVTFTTLGGIIFNPDLTYGSISDNDGNTYKTILIGTQTWMAENLKTTKYNDGTVIPLVTVNSSWEALTTPGYCWWNNDATNNKATYGALYNWYTVNTGKLCPTGWHVPNDAEWTTLTTYLSGESVAGGKLKETGTTHWQSPNTGATNESGFTALPGGYRFGHGAFGYVGDGGFWWSSSEYSTINAWYRYMYYNSSSVFRYSYYYKNFGFSVRCVKDATAPIAIGDSYQGGVVAYILQSGDPGFVAGQTHGLIAAPSDQSAGIQWYNGSFSTTSVVATALGTGNANTNTVVTSQGAGTYAAKLCADLVLGGYSDWYLPSKDELNKLYLNKVVIGGFATNYYWSSSEYNSDGAWAQYFGTGYQGYYTKSNNNSFVRAVRSF
jgi:uncharacterized protein (TIGR02145 family)